MDKLANWILCLPALILLGAAPAAYTCSTIQLTSQNGDVVVGRTMDFGFDLQSQIEYYPTGQYHTTLPNGQRGRQWWGKYRFIGISPEATPNSPIDGVNEKGLAAEALLFPEYADYGPKKVEASRNNTMLLNDFFKWVLSRFESVSEVNKHIKDLHLWAKKVEALHGHIPSLHFMIHDRTGHNIIIEYMNDGRLKTYKDRASVMTNSPDFRWHMINMKQYFNLTPYTKDQVQYRGESIPKISQGNGFYGLPGDFTSSSRFAREFIFLRTALEPSNHHEAIRLAMHIINSVDIPKGTVRSKHDNKTLYDHTYWTLLKDLSANVVYIRPYNSLNYVKLDLNQVWKYNRKLKPVLIKKLATGNQAADITSAVVK